MFEYRELFMKFEYQKTYGSVLVLLDQNYFDRFHVGEIEDQAGFEKVCKDYLDSEEYREAKRLRESS